MFIFVMPFFDALLNSGYRCLEAFEKTYRLELNNTLAAVAPISFKIET